MRFPLRCVLVTMLGAAMPPAAASADPAVDVRTVTVATTVGSRTSLRVSTQVLEFEVATAGAQATAAVDFSAGARTRTGDEVLLTVEPAAVHGPGGAAAGGPHLSFAGIGEGTLSGFVDASGLAVAARWQGSGMRKGRLLFSLRAAAPGRYVIPVRLLLTVP